MRLFKCLGRLTPRPLMPSLTPLMPPITRPRPYYLAHSNFHSEGRQKQNHLRFVSTPQITAAAQPWLLLCPSVVQQQPSFSSLCHNNHYACYSAERRFICSDQSTSTQLEPIGGHSYSASASAAAVSAARHNHSASADAASASAAVDVPTAQQLWRHFFNAAVPMVGFGFIDNFIMLQAGEILDVSIGVTFGLATLTAAAVGQIFSDVSGVAMGGIVQAVAGKHLPPSGLDVEQRRLGICRVVGTLGRMIGVIAGCLLGMTSLLFMDLEESQRLKRFKELQPILTTIIRHTKRLANVSTCRIYLLGVNAEGEEILFEVGQSNGNPTVQPIDNPTSPSSSFSSLSLSPAASSNNSAIRAFSHHFNRATGNNNNHHVAHESDSNTSPAPSHTATSYLQCVRVAPSSSAALVLSQSATTPMMDRAAELHAQPAAASSSRSNVSAEAVVRFVARTGQAVMCVKQQQQKLAHQCTSAAAGQIPAEWMVASYTDQLLLAATSPVNNSVLCYPVFDDMDRDRVIGVIELADKVAASPTDVGAFTREDERLVRMLSEHLSLYLAMTNYRNANVTDEVESVEKIAFVCPDGKERTSE